MIYYPGREKEAEQDYEGPTTAETGEVIGQTFSQAPPILKPLVDIFCKRIMLCDTFRDLAIEFREFPVLGLEQILKIQGSVVRKLVAADKCVARDIWMIDPDTFHQTGPQRFQRYEIATWMFFA